MRRNLLTCLLCLGGLLSYAQDSTQQKLSPERFDPASIIYNVISSTKGNSQVKLDWRTDFPDDIDYYTIERASNGHEFEVVSVLKQNDGRPIRQWTDEAPEKGRNLYRIRCIMKNGLYFVSRPVAVHLAGDISFRFYPNPVDNILIIRSESPVDIQILDANGKVRVQQSQLQGLQLVNVSSLQKGIYLIRAQNRESNSVVQEKLLKN